MSGTATSPGPHVSPQSIVTPSTRSAIFLTLTLDSGTDAAAAVRDFCTGLSGLIRAVESHDPDTGLCCVMGIGSTAWDRVFGRPRPAELHPFREFKSGGRHALATDGDLLFHLRSNRADLCFELAARIMARLEGVTALVDEVHGFRYLDDRDLIGFVDGTENPRGQEATDAVLIGPEDPAFAGGSYVIVQKYLHHMDRWNAQPTEAQERAIGRTKLDNIELDDAVKPSNAHNALTVITENGEEKAILRANMPFGQPGQQEFGTYFIGYCRTPRITEQMLENMFVGSPPGNYDRLLDFTRPVTGCLFFVPSATFLASGAPLSAASANADPPQPEATAEPPQSDPPQSNPPQSNPPQSHIPQSHIPQANTGAGGSLGIGSLKGDTRHE